MSIHVHTVKSLDGNVSIVNTGNELLVEVDGLTEGGQRRRVRAELTPENLLEMYNACGQLLHELRGMGAFDQRNHDPF